METHTRNRDSSKRLTHDESDDWLLFTHRQDPSKRLTYVECHVTPGNREARSPIVREGLLLFALEVDHKTENNISVKISFVTTV